jgi:hypothetical protein
VDKQSGGIRELWRIGGAGQWNSCASLWASSWSPTCAGRMFTDFENFSVFKPDPRHEDEVNAMVDQVIAWGGALKTVRLK